MGAVDAGTLQAQRSGEAELGETARLEQRSKAAEFIGLSRSREAGKQILSA